MPRLRRGHLRVLASRHGDENARVDAETTYLLLAVLHGGSLRGAACGLRGRLTTTETRKARAAREEAGRVARRKTTRKAKETG